jgi:amidase
MSPQNTYLSATEWMQALRTGQVSAREALEMHVDRVNALNPRLNAVVAMDLDGARRRADEADRARQRGEDWGPLHGLPMTIKDTWAVPGMTCTAGTLQHKDHRPTQAAWAVQRLLDAGAVVFGKTNVPFQAMDIQSFNDVYGTSNNPWVHAARAGQRHRRLHPHPGALLRGVRPQIELRPDFDARTHPRRAGHLV